MSSHPSPAASYTAKQFESRESRQDATSSNPRRLHLLRQRATDSILLTPKQAAEMLATPAGTLKRWRAEGRGPAWIKLEGSVRYELSVIQQYIESNRHLPSVRTLMEEKHGSL